MNLPFDIDKLYRRFSHVVNYGFKLGTRSMLRDILNLMNAYDKDGQYEGSPADWQGLKDNVADMLKEAEEADDDVDS